MTSAGSQRHHIEKKAVHAALQTPYQTSTRSSSKHHTNVRNAFCFYINPDSVEAANLHETQGSSPLAQKSKAPQNMDAKKR